MHKLPQLAQTTIDKLSEHNFEAFAVGGSVRDTLMNLPTKGWDFATNATPEEILKIFPNGFYDNEFGTVGIPLKNDAGETQDVFEVTTYRSEKGYTNKRHPDEISWGKTIEEDLARRDLTINAIAWDGKKFIDPYNGQSDIENKIIKAVGDPHDRFSEDALRMLRAIRIATQLAFVLEEKTFAAIQKHAPLLTSISADRVRQELLKIMATNYPADGVMLLKNAGILKIILPEIEKSFGVPQKSPKRHHIYDVGTHLVMSLHHCPSTDPLVRFATLLHDIGKPNVFHKDGQSQLITFYNHEVVGARIVKDIAYRLNFSKKDREKLIILARWHQFTVDEKQTDNTLRRFIRRVGKENLKDMLDVRIGDRLGGGAQETSWRLRLFIKRLEEVQKQPFTISDLAISGHDVMKILGISPGPKVGETLQKLFDKVITNEFPNERDILLEKIEEIK